MPFTDEEIAEMARHDDEVNATITGLEKERDKAYATLRRVVGGRPSTLAAAATRAAKMIRDHDAERARVLAERDEARADVEKLRARFRLAPGPGRYVPDETPVTVSLPRNAIDFLATLVGGTGADVWGAIAPHFGLMPDGVEAVFDILSAAAHAAPRCVSCNGDLVKQGEAWVHLAAPGCDALIVPEGLQDGDR